MNKKWLYDNPKLARQIMEKNERYIFFEAYKGSITGSSGVSLLPMSSVAVDTKYIKYGTLLIIQNIYNNEDVFLAIAHDKGNAIKGKNRIDLFTGYGLMAEKEAATLNKKIKVWELNY